MTILLAALLCACSNAVPEPTQAPPAPPPAASPAPPPPAPAPVEKPPDPPTAPEAQYGPVTGWLGFVAGQRSDDVWVPDEPAGKVVLLQGEGWEGQVPGAAYQVVSGQALVPVRLAAVGEVPIGCDNTPTAAVTFEASVPLEPGPVWILPAEAIPGTRTLQVSPRPRKSADSRAWRVGSIGVTVEKTSPTKGIMHLSVGATEVYSQPVERYQMGEGDAEPFDLYRRGEPGLPEPVVAWRLGGDQKVLVLQTHSFEGIHHHVLVVGATEATEVGGLDTYLCAY